MSKQQRSVGFDFFNNTMDDLYHTIRLLKGAVAELSQQNQELERQYKRLSSKLNKQLKSQPAPTKQVKQLLDKTCDVQPVKKDTFVGQNLVSQISGKVKNVDDHYIYIDNGEDVQTVPRKPFNNHHNFQVLASGNKMATLTTYLNNEVSIEIHNLS